MRALACMNLKNYNLCTLANLDGLDLQAKNKLENFAQDILKKIETLVDKLNITS